MLRPRPTAKRRSALKGEGKAQIASGLDIGEGVLSGAIAKWLIPSVTALFATVGYLVEFAHEQLLGVAGDRAAGSYVAAAADFFRDLPTILYQTVSATPVGHWHVAHPWLIVMTTSLAVAGLLLQRLSKRFVARQAAPPWLRAAGSWAPVAAVVLIVAMKFVVLDAPLGDVKGILLQEGLAGVSAKSPASLRQTPQDACREGDAARFRVLGRSAASSRADALQMAIICSRVDSSFASRARGANSENARTQQAYQDLLRGEFISHLWVYAMIVVSAWSVLVSPPSPVSAGLAILALAYGLTLANAYGKLEKSTEFDYGVLRLSEALQKATPPPTNPRLAPAQPGRLEALILSRGASGLELLAIVPGDCANAPGNRFARVKHTWIASSHVLSIQELYRQDAITWVALNKAECPPEAPPIDMFRP